MKSLSDDCIDVITSYAAKLPHEESEVSLPHMEGAPSRVDPFSNAFPHRFTPFLLNLHTRWRPVSDDEPCRKWARDFHDATRPFSQGVYVNFLSEEGSDCVREAYTEEVWDRLVKAKKSWDPEKCVPDDGCGIKIAILRKNKSSEHR